MVRSNASWVMVTWDPLVNTHTHTTNNTFLLLCWQAVINAVTIVPVQELRLGSECSDGKVAEFH